MGSMSLVHWLVVLAIVLVLFGAGKLPRVMGDFAKGIKAFKAGMAEEDAPAAASPPPAQAQVTSPPPQAAPAATVAQPHEHA
ncbi:MAG: twin-arginine translocase TatA/TatE family subunit [Stellaceae bacterium]